MQRGKYNVYSYSAADNEEIRRIREKYEFGGEPKVNSKLDELRKLDRSVHKTATVIAISIGVAGVLIFGFGLTCILEWGETMLVPGILIGIIGGILVIAAMPVYNVVERIKRKKIAPEIIRLADELLK